MGNFIYLQSGHPETQKNAIISIMVTSEQMCRYRLL